MKIKRLDEQVYTRIAAGEVVLNPASVIKELVENAIDAGASAITVEISGGGKEFLNVTDNGEGISAEDMPLTIEKHATSKIREIGDLDNIASLGFRGEALSSIAAVSNLTIYSRTKSSIEGSSLSISGGKKLHIAPAGLPEGTSVTVSNLFFNTPARKKFLKSMSTEGTNIMGIMAKLMLSRPDISMKLVSNGKTIYHTPGTGERIDVIRAIYGGDTAGKLLPIEYENGGLSIFGYVSQASLLYRSGKYISLFLNGRYIRSRAIRDAVMLGYGERLLKAHFPFALIDIHLPPAQMDVNVHPHKLQANLFDEQRVIDAVIYAVRGALNRHEAPPVVQAYRQAEKSAPAVQAAMPPAHAQKERIFSQKPARVAQNPDAILEGAATFLSATDDFESVMDTIIEQSSAKQEQLFMEDVRKLVDYRILGQVFKTYLAVESDGALYIIDQHAAHERITYERIKQQLSEGGAISQQLISPLIKNMQPDDYDLFMQNEEFLLSLGFSFDPFGTYTLKFTALPVEAEKSGADALIEDVLMELQANKTDIVLLKDRVIKSACKRSIKAGDGLDAMQIEALMEEISQMNAIPNCPHGRPIAVALRAADLEKSFKRRV